MAPTKGVESQTVKAETRKRKKVEREKLTWAHRDRNMRVGPISLFRYTKILVITGITGFTGFVSPPREQTPSISIANIYTPSS